MPPSSSPHIEQASELATQAFSARDPQVINEIALELFRLQAQHVPVYSSFLEGLKIDPENLENVDEIPYLPISFFKSHEVFMNGASVQVEFQSSGTTGMERSRNFLHDPSIYETSYTKAFEQLFGPLNGLCILALLPNYMEQNGSSLIHMVQGLMDRSAHPRNGFCLDEFEALSETLLQLESEGQRSLLIGVPYALLDFLEDRSFELKHTVLMETGGMKGRREEMIRSELHGLLKSKTGLSMIHSEYGMTELMSQAYSMGDGIFESPAWMRIRIREVNDPFTVAKAGKTGGIDVMDLANAHSCAFISTMDLGREMDDTRFEVLGRFDNSDVRGCNLLVQ